MLTRFSEGRMLKVRGRQRTDSTHVLASVRAMSQVETIGETLRHARNVLADEVPNWCQVWVQQFWRQDAYAGKEGIYEGVEAIW